MAEAARYLRITPAAISKHVLSLENQLGIQLLHRSTRRSELTPEGMIYFEHAKLILEAYRQAEAAVSETREEPSGTLKLVCGPQVGTCMSSPILRSFWSSILKFD